MDIRYRIIIEVDVDEKVNRQAINNLAMEMMDCSVTHWSKPVFVATDLAPSQTIEILRK
jgi:hypothetical protein